MQNTLIVLPTYNERGNVLELLPQLKIEFPQVEILVVDDNSPDGTAAAVQELQKKAPHIHILQRPKKEGLGRAYVDGFEWALKRNYKTVVQMDADFSHRILDLKTIFATLESDTDFIVGSRWISGGQVRNWSWWRWLLSKVGNMYVRCILGGQINDWTGGFNLWRAPILAKMELATLESQGYSFQIELKYRALRLNFKGREVPILFEERRLGQSKMSFAIIFEALTKVWHLKSKF